MSDLSSPLYANKPQRKIPRTNGCVAVTMYASADRTVRNYTIFREDGVFLGTVSYHPRRLARSAGYHRGHGVWRHDDQTWRNLTDAAWHMMKERL